MNETDTGVPIANLPPPGSTQAAPEVEPATEHSGSRKWLIIGAIIAALLLAGVIVGLVFLSKDPAAASQVRDIFIIVIALQMFVIGIALIILIIQLASLTNVLKNEVKPILHSTTETVNTLRGTVRFLSDNLSEPVIKLNETLASIRKFAVLFHLRNNKS
mgnify:CR=1 FL=1